MQTLSEKRVNDMDFFILWLIISTVFMAGRLLADLGRDEEEEKGRIRTDFNLLALAMNMYEQATMTPTQKNIARRERQIAQKKQEDADFQRLETLDKEYEALIYGSDDIFLKGTSEKPKHQEQPLHRGIDPLPHFRRELSLGRDLQIRTGSLRPDYPPHLHMPSQEETLRARLDAQSLEEKEKALQAKIDAAKDRWTANILDGVYGAHSRSANYCPECKWFHLGHACSCSLTRNGLRWAAGPDMQRVYADGRLVYADGGLVWESKAEEDEATAEEAAFHRYMRSTREERV